MLISSNLIKKHIKNSEDINFYDVWETFTIRTAEVEEIKQVTKNFENVVTAKITSVEKHPKSKTLTVLKVTDGKEEYTVMCGAPNVRVGLIGALAKVGGKVGDLDISERPILGVPSEGMMCSSFELEIGEDHEGIIDLPEDTPLGVPFEDLVSLDDIIVEIDNKSLTNRPDLWGHYGIAREVAAITNKELKPLELLTPENNKQDLNIKINNPDIAFRYMGVQIDNVLNHTTPLELELTLHRLGMRKVDLLVDLTNFVMLELGQPMHAFDSRKVKEIEVGLGKNNTTFTTLDNEVRKITDEDLMIKNGDEYFGIAGVMGGLDSEVEEDTTSIILESASFDSTTIRKTSTRLGLRTEASTRFEKALDPNLAELALKRFLYLLKEHNEDMEISSNVTDVYPTKQKRNKITLTKEKLYKYMGFEISDKKVEEILRSLEFKVKTNQDNFEVKAPTFRSTKDVTLDADVIEEISRMYGYENIELTPLNMELSFFEKDNLYDRSYDIKNYLSNKYNLHEVHTYLWNKTKFLNLIDVQVTNTKLLNKKEDSVLRDDLSLSMLEHALVNVRNRDVINIYEIGTVINNNENEKRLSILLTNESLKDVYNKAKDITTNMFKDLLNKEVIFELSKPNKDYYNEEIFTDIIVNNNIIGNIKLFKRNVVNKLSSRLNFITIDINFEEYLKLDLNSDVYEQVSRYPEVEKDYTITLEKGEHYKVFDELLNKFTSPIIKERKLIDIYLDDKKHITIKYILGSNEKTLSTKDIDHFNKEFINFIKDNNMKIETAS